MFTALVQSNPKVGDLRGNSERALAELNRLAAEPYPPDLVIFPAFALTGAPVDGMQSHHAFAVECLDTIADFCARSPLPVLIGALYPKKDVLTEEFVCYPEIVYVDGGRGEILQFSDRFEAGSDQVEEMISFIEVAGNKIAVFLNDLPDPADDFDDFEAIIVLGAKEFAGSETMLLSSPLTSLFKEIAVEKNVWFVFANLSGAADDVIFEGASMIVSPHGQITACATPFIEDTITNNLSRSDPPSEVLVKPMLPYEALWYSLVVGVRDYCYKNGFSDCVLGLSGGIDSSVVCALAVDALGAEHVHGILMPSQNSSSGSIDDATMLARNLDIKTIILPVTVIYDAFMRLYANTLDASTQTMQPASNLALQNIQARIRTLHLMHLSNSYGWLLLNTGNKSEAAMGYSTLYGDTAGALAPLGNIYKGDVYGLAKWCNRRGFAIPEDVLNKPPSAELYPGQQDSDSLPDYAILDTILRLHLEKNMGADQIIVSLRDSGNELNIDANTVLEVLDRVRAAEFKRRQEPLALNPGEFDFIETRNWPITNGFKDRDRKVRTTAEVLRFIDDVHRDSGPRDFDFYSN